MLIWNLPLLANGEDDLDRLAKGIERMASILINAPMKDVLKVLEDDQCNEALDDLRNGFNDLAKSAGVVEQLSTAIETSSLHVETRATLQGFQASVENYATMVDGIRSRWPSARPDLVRTESEMRIGYLDDLRNRFVGQLSQAAKLVRAHRSSWLENGAVVRPAHVAEWISVTNAAKLLSLTREEDEGPVSKGGITKLVANGDLADNLKTGPERRIFAASIVALMMKRMGIKEAEERVRDGAPDESIEAVMKAFDELDRRERAKKPKR